MLWIRKIHSLAWNTVYLYVFIAYQFIFLSFQRRSKFQIPTKTILFLNFQEIFFYFCLPACLLPWVLTSTEYCYSTYCRKKIQKIPTVQSTSLGPCRGDRGLFAFGACNSGVHRSTVLTSDGIRNFLKNIRNSTVFFAVKMPGIPSVFAYGISHVSKWERKVPCRMYVMIFYNTEIPRDKVN